MEKILISGTSGFIGSEIHNTLLKQNKLIIKNIDLRIKQKDIIRLINNDSFDVYIHAAGIHPYRDEFSNKELFLKNKVILKKIKKILTNSKKIILISSFINLINYENKETNEKNKLRIYKEDNYYKKSKYLTEKYFLKLSKKFKKELIILYPCHVIGPNDWKLSPNGKFLLNMRKRKIKFFFDIHYPITDVREISSYVSYILKKNLISHKKLIINGDIEMKEYINKLMQNNNFLFLRLSKYFYLSLSIINKILIKIKILNKDYFPISTYRYLKLNPKTNSIIKNNYKNNYFVDETIFDTLAFFKKNGKF